ncbi:AraC family transcriptional activator of pobA [Rhodovulum iodosum]|uniref:AraC family transcriptional activator of pobA n=1 Tax=Rhodovulum iodosum TaxID=68291 RepID=A0ABV3XX12_9RHOB|nr:AraC family transcriptional regulator [Rhodovulum robiginosum]RSK38506.1 AraC family transcriptional regulator [Rhodovulum robiginosum]
MSDTVPDLRMTPIAQLMQGGRWRVESMRSYTRHQLLWFTRGQGRLTVAGITRGFGVHNAAFIPAGTMHAFEITAAVYGTALFFADDPALALPDAPHHLRIRESAAQVELTALLETLQRELDGDRPARARALRQYLGLLSVWLERQLLVNDDQLAPTDAARRLAAGYAALVERDFHTPLSVSDYAAALGVTPTHLTRVCHQTCGRTASELLAERKIGEARRLLADTKLPVKDIAVQLGYRSPAYFTRVFQARTGRAPLTFRKSG